MEMQRRIYKQGKIHDVQESENDKAIFEPIPFTEQTTGRNGLRFGMDANFGKVFGAMEAFFEFRLRTRDMGYP